MKPGLPGQNNAAAGPSSMIGQQAMNQQRNTSGQGQPGQQQQQQQPQRMNKRSSNSPGEDNDNQPRNESSPPERKRVRRSPMEQANNGNPGNMTPMGMGYPPQQQQQGHPGQQLQQQQQGGPPPQNMPMMRMNGYPGAMGGMSIPLGMTMGVGVANMGNTMNPAMSPAMSHQGMMTPQMQQVSIFRSVFLLVHFLIQCGHGRCTRSNNITCNERRNFDT